MIRELCQLLRYVPKYVKNWSSNVIESYNYRLYGRKKPVNMATEHFINTVRTKITINMLCDKKAADLQIIRCSHHDWVGAQYETYQSIYKIVKEPDNLLFF